MLKQVFGRANSWTKFNTVPASIGELVLESDGSVWFGPYRVDQSVALENAKIFGVVVSKKAGSGEVISINVGHRRTLGVKFFDGKWYYRTT